MRAQSRKAAVKTLYDDRVVNDTYSGGRFSSAKATLFR